MRRTILVMAIFLLTGCATSPVPVVDSRSVPQERRLPGLSPLAAARAGSARITIVRDSGFFGALAGAKLFVDGVPVATLGTGERIEFYVPAGSHIFGVILQPEFTHTVDETSFTFEATKSYYFRVTSDEDGHCHIQPSALLR